MPGSLLEPLISRKINQGSVRRANSAHSDRSDATAYSSEGGSSKKVSFNKAVRVKKYSNPPQQNLIDLQNSKFWFKVHTINSNHKQLSSKSKLEEELLNITHVQFDFNNNSLKQKEFSEIDYNKRLSTIAESDSSSIRSTPKMQRKEPVVINYNSDTKPNETKRRVINYTPYRSKNSDYIEKDSNQNGFSSSVFSYQHETKVQDIPRDSTYDYFESQQKQKSAHPTKDNTKTTETVKVIEKKSPFLSGFKVMFGASAKAAPTFSLNESKEEKKNVDLEDELKSSKIFAQNSYSHQSIEKQKEQENLNYQKINYGRPNKYKYNNSDSTSLKDQSNDQSPNDYQTSVKVNVPTSFEDDSFVKNHLIPMETWESGPTLISEFFNKERDTLYVPGEGKSYINREEGSQVWENKIRRKYEEVSKFPKVSSKEKQMNEKNKQKLQSSSPSPNSRKNISKSVEYSRKTDDNKLSTNAKQEVEEVIVKKQASILGNESDFFPYLDSYLPKMEDKACQCNLKKSSQRSSSEIGSNFRVIKSNKDGSVSTFSDVPLLSVDNKMQKKTPIIRNDAIYSQIDKTKKRNMNLDVNYDDQDENNNIKEMGDYFYASNPTKAKISQSPIRLERSPSPFKLQEPQKIPSKSRKTITTVTKGHTFNFEPGVKAPVVKMPLKHPTCKYYSKSASNHSRISDDELFQESCYLKEKNYPKPKSDIKKEIIEETMSISNISSDDMVPHINTDNEDNLAPKSVLREIDHQRGELSYENLAPHKLSSKNSHAEEISNSSSLWFKALDEDYRKGMTEREVSYQSINKPVNYPSSTLSKAEISRKYSRKDYSPADSRHAYTLDRKHLEDRKTTKRLFSNYAPFQNSKNVEIFDTRSEKLGSSNIKRFSSNHDLVSDIYDTKKGGLAAAYKARQKRAASMDRYGNINLERYHSALILNGYGRESNRNSNLSRHSSSEIEIPVQHTRTLQKHHKNDPVVLYIPAISHHERKVDIDDRSSGINLTRTQSLLSNSKRSFKRDKKELKDITSKLNGYVKLSPSELEEDDEIVELRDEEKESKKSFKKKNIKRNYSMPKDTKLPWLSRFRFKIKPKN